MQTRFKFILLLCVFSFASCSGNQSEKEKKEKKEEKLTKIVNGIYTEYYPGGKVIKFKGGMDSNESRNGSWYFYDEKGNEMSMTEYVHGKKEGVTFVRYPSGNMRYVGQYANNQPVGKWKTFSEDGKQNSEHDYGNPALTEAAKTE